MLICGGAGYIGSSFLSYLKNKDFNLVVVDNLSTGHFMSHSLPFYQCDIGDTKKLIEIMKKHEINVVFHFCAFLEVGESVRDPLKYYENNIAKGIGLLRACISSGINCFVFSSSAAVYGEPIYSPIDE